MAEKHKAPHETWRTRLSRYLGRAGSSASTPLEKTNQLDPAPEAFAVTIHEHRAVMATIGYASATSVIPSSEPGKVEVRMIGTPESKEAYREALKQIRQIP